MTEKSFKEASGKNKVSSFMFIGLLFILSSSFSLQMHPKGTFVQSKVFARAKTHSARTAPMQVKSPSPQIPFRFRANDPKEHTVRCCSNETLDPCDYNERLMDFVKHGMLPPMTPANNNLEMELEEPAQQPDDQLATIIGALPMPMDVGGSQTTIDGCPNMLGAENAYMLTPLTTSTAAYFRSMGVPSRIYTCRSALHPSQPGQLTFQMVQPNVQQQQQAQFIMSNEQQPQRAAFAIVNVNYFNFIGRMN